MKFTTKLLLLLLVGAFPAGLLLLKTFVKSPALPSLQVEAQASPTLNAALEAKASELAGLDVKILASKGELMKFEDNKRAVVAELETLRSKIGTMIEASKAEIAAAASGP